MNSNVILGGTAANAAEARKAVDLATAFVNGSLNSAKNNDPTAPNYKKTVAKAPRSTLSSLE